MTRRRGRPIRGFQKLRSNKNFGLKLRSLEKCHIVRAARVQNETAPEKLLNRYEKRFEKLEKGSEKRSETRLKKF